jgi:hypothetical protein
MLLSENKPPKYSVRICITDMDEEVITVCRKLTSIILKGGEVALVGSATDAELLKELGISGNYYTGNRDIMLALVYLLRLESSLGSSVEIFNEPRFKNAAEYLGNNINLRYYFIFEEDIDDIFDVSCKILETEDVPRFYLTQCRYIPPAGYGIKDLPDWYVTALIAASSFTIYIMNSSLNVTQPDVIIPYSYNCVKHSIGNH